VGNKLGGARNTFFLSLSSIKWILDSLRFPLDSPFLIAVVPIFIYSLTSYSLYVCKCLNKIILRIRHIDQFYADISAGCLGTTACINVCLIKAVSSSLYILSSISLAVILNFIL
jgi:hypothetical protein